ncbi:MAG: sulfate/thiosulfate transport system substrate-binding protein [Solirubrobacterales bacterium]|jgi:sulfate transport system substrate-binding protein|nr:sulfate/thiosulfate transport system substrate-binding protein [Solirubrobacterales bacterium]
MRNARKVTRRRSVNAAILAALFALAAVIAGCGSSSGSGSSGGGKLDVVGYSTPESVYQEDLEPAFEKTSAGSGVSFSNSFGASGDQSRAVVAGQPASVVHFSQAGDMERLVEEGELVAKDWEKQPHGGIATDSVVVLVVRKGNPQGIQTFDDLQSKDVGIVTPNPFSSGSARWNIMAVYGTAINEGKSSAQALEAVKTVLEKTKAQPGSARDALAAFTQGEGDVLLSYENEAIKAENEGEDIEYIVPPSTILIETPIAVTKDAPEPAAEAFLKFIWSDEGQEIWAENGYRPVNPKLVDTKQFPTPKELFKISQFGGWGKVNEEFFDDEAGSVAKIEGELGVSTSG